MQSIALALTHDYVRRSAWPTAMTLLYQVGLPWAGHGLMLWHGLRLPEDEVRAFPLSFGFLVLAMFGGLLIVFCGQGENRFGIATKLYVLPIETWLLVGCRMLQAALTTAALYVFVAVAYSLSFGLHWPLLGPALALAVVAMWTQAFAWALLHFRVRRVVALVGVLAALGYWIAQHFTVDSLPAGMQPWETFTVGDFLMLCGFGAAAFGVSVQSVARHRRGDCESFATWLTSLERYWHAAFVHREQRFPSANDALFWIEWSRRGIALPASMACLLLVVPLAGAAGVALGWTRPIEVLEIELAMALAVFPQIACIVGMFLGHRNTNNARMEYDSFGATRPVTDAALSAAFLRSTALAVLSGFGVSLAFCLITAGWTAWHEGADALLSLKHQKLLADSPLGWWALLVVVGASLAASWMCTGLGASIVLAGQPRFTGWAIGLPIGGFVLWILTLKSFVPVPWQSLVAAVGAGVFGLACISGTFWTFSRALKKRLTMPRTVCLSALAWLALCGLAAIILTLAPPVTNPPSTATERWLALPLVPGLLALVFAPLATAPLALAWNRHR